MRPYHRYLGPIRVGKMSGVGLGKYQESGKCKPKIRLKKSSILNNHLEIHLTKHTLVEMPVYSEDSVSCFSFSEWVLKKGVVGDFQGC